MGTFDRQKSQAKRMIKKYGELCDWIKENTKPDTSQPWNTSATSNTLTSYKVYIVFVQPGRKLEALFHLIAGTAVPSGAPSGLMAEAKDVVSGTAFTPEIDDSVKRSSGEVLVIKDYNEVAPNGDVILYKLDFA